ncbi:DUF6993 domain-containing protein [Frigoribacterium salinisoli]
MTTPRAARSPLGRVPSVLVGLAAVVLVAGCTSSPEPTPAPSPAAEQAGPVELTADSSVDDARAVFDRTVRELLERDGAPGGRDVVDALVAAGFDKGTLQVTPDSTWTERDADSVQFSALWADSCLVGQVAGGDYAAQTAPVLGTGACLVGTTRAINW